MHWCLSARRVMNLMIITARHDDRRGAGRHPKMASMGHARRTPPGRLRTCTSPPSTPPPSTPTTPISKMCPIREEADLRSELFRSYHHFFFLKREKCDIHVLRNGLFIIVGANIRYYNSIIWLPTTFSARWGSEELRSWEGALVPVRAGEAR